MKRTSKFGQYMVQEIMFYPVSTKTFKLKVMSGTPGMRIVKEIILINSGDKFKSLESSVIGKIFIKIPSTVYQLKSKRIKYLYSIWLWCFPVIFENFVRTTFLAEHLRLMLLILKKCNL